MSAQPSALALAEEPVPVRPSANPRLIQVSTSTLPLSDEKGRGAGLRIGSARFWALMFSLIALALLAPAWFMPMLVMEQFGSKTGTGLVMGLLKLLISSEWNDKLVGAVVALFSVVLPFMKLILLCFTCLFTVSATTQRNLNWILLRTAKWQMAEVMLVAVILFTLKGSPLYKVSVGSGFFYYLAMFVMASVATCFWLQSARRKSCHCSK